MSRLADVVVATKVRQKKPPPIMTRTLAQAMQVANHWLPGTHWQLALAVPDRVNLPRVQRPSARLSLEKSWRDFGHLHGLRLGVPPCHTYLGQCQLAALAWHYGRALAADASHTLGRDLVVLLRLVRVELQLDAGRVDPDDSQGACHTTTGDWIGCLAGRRSGIMVPAPLHRLGQPAEAA